MSSMCSMPIDSLTRSSLTPRDNATFGHHFSTRDCLYEEHGASGASGARCERYGGLATHFLAAMTCTYCLTSVWMGGTA